MCMVELRCWVVSAGVVRFLHAVSDAVEALERGAVEGAKELVGWRRAACRAYACAAGSAIGFAGAESDKLRSGPGLNAMATQTLAARSSSTQRRARDSMQEARRWTADRRRRRQQQQQQQQQEEEEEVRVRWRAVGSPPGGEPEAPLPSHGSMLMSVLRVCSVYVPVGSLVITA